MWMYVILYLLKDSLCRDRVISENGDDEEKLDGIHYKPHSVPLNQTRNSSSYKIDGDSEIDLMAQSDSDSNPLLPYDRGNDTHSTSYRSREVVEHNIEFQSESKSSNVSIPCSPYQSGGNNGSVGMIKSARNPGNKIDTKWSLWSAWRNMSVSLNSKNDSKGELKNGWEQKLATEDQDSSLCVVCFGSVRVPYNICTNVLCT